MLWSVKSVKKPVWKLGYEAVSEVSDFKNNRAHEEWFSTIGNRAREEWFLTIGLRNGFSLTSLTSLI
jgi:hypothetical protein